MKSTSRLLAQFVVASGTICCLTSGGEQDQAAFAAIGRSPGSSLRFLSWLLWRSLCARVLVTAWMLTLLWLLPAAAQAQGVVEAWVQRYDGPGNFFDDARAIAVDASGNVYVTGSSCRTGSYGSEDYVTIKYSSAGVPLWTNRYSGPGNYTDEPTALALDRSGNVYVTGHSDGATGSGYKRDYATVAYSSAGVPLWTNRYGGPYKAPGNYPSIDDATAAGVDANGNVYVTGNSTGADGYSDHVTIKYSGAGVPLWTNRYSGPPDRSTSALALAVDTSGNVIVTGGFDNFDGTATSLTVAYSSAGVLLWTNSGPEGWASALAEDASGTVYVMVETRFPDSGRDYAIVAYSSAGVPLWTNSYNGPADGDDLPTAVAVDAMGNVYVTGGSQGLGSDYDYLTVAYSNAGVPLWTNRYDGPGNYTDIASGVAVDARGNVYVTGQSAGDQSTPSGYDYATIAYSSAGIPLWTNRYNGPGNGADGGTAIAVDASGNVYVTGNSVGIGTDSDIVTVKYAPFKPSLSISTVGSEVRIAWPASATGWDLRRASGVKGPYSDPGLSVTTEGNESVVYDSLAAGSRFYRLEQSP